MINVNDLRSGMSIKYEGDILTVVDYQHVKPGKGAAFVKTKLKNLRSGATYEVTFNSSVKVEQAVINKVDMQYLYNTGDAYFFMDLKTYEQLEIPVEKIGENKNFLKENEEVNIALYEGEIIGITLPDKVTLKVIETEPGVKGNTAQAATKEATVETGYIVRVPLFINKDEDIIISTADGKYVSRA